MVRTEAKKWKTKTRTGNGFREKTAILQAWKSPENVAGINFVNFTEVPQNIKTYGLHINHKCKNIF